MRIAQVDVYQVQYKLSQREYAWSGGHSVVGFLTTITRITTDTGLQGYSEVCPLGSGYMEAYARGIPAGIAELSGSILGFDPTDIRGLNTLMDNRLGGHNYVKSAIDIACWDILGKAAGLPVATLLGGRREDIHLYRAISQGTPEQMANDVLKYRGEGYRRFQLKVGSDPDDDIQRIEAVLAVVQPGDVVVADANTGWLPHQALRVVNALAGRDYYVEQPCPSLAECLRIRKAAAQPMVLDEVITSAAALIQAYEAQAMDVVNIKISRVGGLTKAKQIRDLCESLGIAMTIEDSWGGDVTTATIAHIAGSARPSSLFSSTDFNSYVDTRLADDAPRRQNGRLRVPSGPGLGITVDDSRLGTPVATFK